MGKSGRSKNSWVCAFEFLLRALDREAKNVHTESENRGRESARNSEGKLLQRKACCCSRSSSRHCLTLCNHIFPFDLISSFISLQNKIFSNGGRARKPVQLERESGAIALVPGATPNSRKVWGNWDRDWIEFVWIGGIYGLVALGGACCWGNLGFISWASDLCLVKFSYANGIRLSSFLALSSSPSFQFVSYFCWILYVFYLFALIYVIFLSLEWPIYA